MSNIFLKLDCFYYCPKTSVACILPFCFRVLSYIYIYHYIFILIIIYSYDLLFRVWSEWLELLATYWQSSSSLQRLEIGNEENYLKNWKWWEIFYVWNIGNVEDYFVFSTKVFSLKLSSNSLLNVHILAHWKSFVTLLRFLLIFSDERQTTKCWSINFLLIGSLFLFLQCCNMLKLSGALCKCRLKAWQFNFVDIFPPNPFPFTFF